MLKTIEPNTDALNHSLRYEPDVKKFIEQILPETDTISQLATLQRVLTDPKLDGKVHSESFPAKMAAIYDSVAESHPHKTEDLLIATARSGHPEVFQFMLDRESDTDSRAAHRRHTQALLAATGIGQQDLDVELDRRIPARNAEILLEKYKFSDHALLAALAGAVKNAETEVLEVLIPHARPEIINMPTESGSTLFKLMLEKRRNERGSIFSASYDTMTTALLEAKAVPPERFDNMPVAQLMESQGFSARVIDETVAALNKAGHSTPAHVSYYAPKPKPKWQEEIAPKEIALDTKYQEEPYESKLDQLIKKKNDKGNNPPLQK